LANAVERAVILSRGGVLRPEAFAEDVTSIAVLPAGPTPAAAPPGPGAPLPAVGAAPPPRADLLNLDELEAIAIQRALVATAGNRTRAAKLLGISERTLRNKLNIPKPVPTT
jgi:DNA-binding NtrC family response regulator